MSLPDPDTLVYAGIGSRQTPAATLNDMTTMSSWLARNGWHLSSGGADGADTAFANGTPVHQRSIFLPWNDYNKLSGPDCITPNRSQLNACIAVAARLHPTWERCTQGAQRLHGRNAAILLGPDLDRPVNAVVAWTPGGTLKGGTGMGLRIAAEHNIPVLNLGSMTPRQACEQLQAMRQLHLGAGEDLIQGQSPQTQAGATATPLGTQANTYQPSDVCGFRFTRETWGAFSNFQPLATPIAAGPWTFASTEHLYQSAKFGPSPDVQERIASTSSAREAAQLGRSAKGINPDWSSQRIDVMRWIIRVKHEANPGEIATLLERTGDKPIVEISNKDAFWGAKPQGHTLQGANVLGHLWMELREQIRAADPAALSSHWLDRIDIGVLAQNTSLGQHASAEQSAGETATPAMPTQTVQAQQAPNTHQAPQPSEPLEPIIYNLKHNPDAEQNGAIRIDRQTEWGNPFKIGEHGTRDEVIVLYQKDLWTKIRSGDMPLTALAELNGKDLACHCSPMACHGDVLSRASTWAAAQLELKADQQATLPPADQTQQQTAQTTPVSPQHSKTADASTAQQTMPEARESHSEIHTPPKASTDDQTRHISQNPIHAAVAEFQERWKTHTEAADAAHISPTHIPGHDELILQAERLIDQPAAGDLSQSDYRLLFDIFSDHERHKDAFLELDDISSRLDRSLQTRSDLDYLSKGNQLEITTLDAYPNWLSDAKEIRALGQDIMLQQDIYDPCLTPDKWNKLHEQLYRLDSAILINPDEENTFFMRNKDLYLPPLPASADQSQEALDAQLSYRALRNQWHEHISDAFQYDIHPYEYENHTELLRDMSAVKYKPELPRTAEEALDTLGSAHRDYHHARRDIESQLEKTDTALNAGNTFLHTVEKLQPLDVIVDDINGYDDWHDQAYNLVDKAETITADDDALYAPYLKYHPEISDRLQTASENLKHAIDQSPPFNNQRTLEIAAEHKQTEQHQTSGRGMKI